MNTRVPQGNAPATTTTTTTTTTTSKFNCTKTPAHTPERKTAKIRNQSKKISRDKLQRATQEAIIFFSTTKKFSRLGLFTSGFVSLHFSSPNRTFIS